jgi:hypothetical protein
MGLIRQRTVVFRAFDAIRAFGDEFERAGRAFREAPVAILVSPKIEWDPLPDLHPVIGKRRDRRAFDEGLEALLGGGVVAGVDLVGAEGGADGVVITFDGSQLGTFFKPTGRDSEPDRADHEDGDEDQYR